MEQNKLILKITKFPFNYSSFSALTVFPLTPMRCGSLSPLLPFSGTIFLGFYFDWAYAFVKDLEAKAKRRLNKARESGSQYTKRMKGSPSINKLKREINVEMVLFLVMGIKRI